MTTISRRNFGKLAFGSALMMSGFGFTNVFAQTGKTAICYNVPAEWAGWGNMLQLIAKETGINVPIDNKNSGQSVSQVIAEAKNPVADAMYLGISFAINAKKAGIIEPFKGKGWQSVPDNLKDPDGYWVSIHAGTVGFMVNKEALGDVPVPKSWKDLLDPKYDGMVGFLDPSSAFVGYACAVAANQALGGSLDNFKPGIEFYKKLLENHPIIPKQTAYARCLSGEIPILFDYDFDAYRAKYTDKAPIEFVIPQEGTIQVPYVMCMVKNAPHRENGQAVIDFVLSEKGQQFWAENYLRPANCRLPLRKNSCRIRNTNVQSALTMPAWLPCRKVSAKPTSKPPRANQSIESHYEIPFYVALSASGDHHSGSVFCAAGGETYSGIRVVGKRLRALSRNHHQSPLQHKRPVDHCAFRLCDACQPFRGRPERAFSRTPPFLGT